MDERFEEWFAESENRLIARQCVGPRGMISGLDTGETFGQFIPEEATYIFRGGELNLQRLANHLMSLQQLAEKYRDLSWWDDDFIMAFPEHD